ncbi:hypothetical protein WSS15_22970 [Acetobacter pasteurianus]|nr:hypothetical protein WSS15_22970 [Acetobacter pasteurianus]
MIEVMASSVLNAPIASVWPLVRDFGSIGQWLPGVKSCRIEGNEPGDRVGAIRRGNLTEGLYIGLDYEKVCFAQKKFP